MSVVLVWYRDRDPEHVFRSIPRSLLLLASSFDLDSIVTRICFVKNFAGPQSTSPGTSVQPGRPNLCLDKQVHSASCSAGLALLPSVRLSV